MRGATASSATASSTTRWQRCSGSNCLAFSSVAGAAGAFAVVAEREWGDAARRPAQVFAVVAAASVLTAEFPYTLGLAFALAALAALQTWRFAWFALLAAGTFATSPLAFLLLVIVLLAAVTRSGLLVRPAVAIACTCVAGAVLWRLFPAGGRYPFSVAELAAALVFCGFGMVFTWRVPQARLLSSIFATYAAACLLAYLVPSPIGENIARLRYVAMPVALLTLSLRRWRPLLPALAAFALALSWNMSPLAYSVARSANDPSAERRLLDARGAVPSPAAEPVLPRRGRRHGRPLGRGLPRGGRHPDRPRLVPPGRFPSERAALRPARPPLLHPLAAQDGRPLRRADKRPGRLQRTRRGAAPPQRRLGSRARLPLRDDARSTPCPRRGRSSPGRLARACSRCAQQHRPSACPGPARTASRFATRRTGPAEASASADRDGMFDVETLRAGIVRLRFAVTPDAALATITGRERQIPAPALIERVTPSRVPEPRPTASLRPLPTLRTKAVARVLALAFGIALVWLSRPAASPRLLGNSPVVIVERHWIGRFFTR